MGFGFGMVSGVAPVFVVGWDSTLVVLMLLIPHGGSWLCFPALLPSWSFVHL